MWLSHKRSVRQAQPFSAIRDPAHAPSQHGNLKSIDSPGTRGALNSLNGVVNFVYESARQRREVRAEETAGLLGLRCCWVSMAHLGTVVLWYYACCGDSRGAPN
jgi:hypothetical protein